MKKIVLSILTVAAISAYGQTCENTQEPKKVINGQEENESGEEKSEGKLKLNDLPAHTGGCCSGRVAMTAYVKEGKWTEFYENGQKKRVVIYKPGKAPKVIKQWDEEGNKVALNQNE